MIAAEEYNSVSPTPKTVKPAIVVSVAGSGRIVTCANWTATKMRTAYESYRRINSSKESVSSKYFIQPYSIAATYPKAVAATANEPTSAALRKKSAPAIKPTISAMTTAAISAKPT